MANARNPARSRRRGRGELSAVLWSLRREFAIVGVFSFVANALMLMPTIYMLQVYDRVLMSRSETTLLVVSLITLFLFGVMAFSERMRSRVLVHTGLHLDAVLSSRVFQSSFDAWLRQAGSGSSRAFGDLLQVRQFLTGNGVFAFFDVPWFPIYIAALFFMHPLLGWMGIGFSCVQAALAWFGHRRTVIPAEAASQSTSETGAYLQGKLRNVEVLESMGMVHSLRAHWQRRHERALALQSASQSLGHRINAVSKFIRYSQSSLALGAGGLLVLEGHLSPGGMIASNILMSRALAPIDLLVNTWRPFLSARSAFRRLERLLHENPVRDPNLRRVAPQGALTLTDVTAIVPGRAAPILDAVSMQVQPGSVTVVLGPSGSGKSTLARTILGIWPDVSGEVLLDGLPVSSWDRADLGPHVGYLPQDIELFEGTIAENIARFGKLESEKVIAAARAAGLHEMILRFPKGYDTPVGEAGGLLSGGQRQRVGLARAIYGDPVLVVLDEPNANLDDMGEQALLRAVKQLRDAHRTVVLITHRPGIVAVADHLLLLRDGRVQAFGARDAVLASLQPPARPTPPPPDSGQLAAQSA